MVKHYLLFHIVLLLDRLSTNPFTYSGVHLLAHCNSPIIHLATCIRSYMESSISVLYSESGNHESKNFDREQVKSHNCELS